MLAVLTVIFFFPHLFPVWTSLVSAYAHWLILTPCTTVRTWFLRLDNLLRSFHSTNRKQLLSPTKATLSPDCTSPVPSAFYTAWDPAPSHLDGPPLNLLQFIKIFLLRGARCCREYSRWGLSRGGDSHFPHPNAAQEAHLIARACCWLMLGLLSATAPRSVPAELLPSQSVPSPYHCKGLFLPRCRTLHFSDVEILKTPVPG